MSVAPLLGESGKGSQGVTLWKEVSKLEQNSPRVVELPLVESHHVYRIADSVTATVLAE